MSLKVERLRSTVMQLKAEEAAVDKGYNTECNTVTEGTGCIVAAHKPRGLTVVQMHTNKTEPNAELFLSTFLFLFVNFLRTNK